MPVARPTSSERRSVADQSRLCRRLIEQNGWTDASVCADAGISGSTPLRHRYQRLLHDARAGAYDVVVSEGVDRISRDQERVAALHKLLCYAGIPLVTVSECEISELHVGLKGTHLRQLAPRDRHPEQRTLCWPAGLELAALRQGSGDGAAAGTAEPAGRVDHRGSTLRIVEDALWERVKACQQATRSTVVEDREVRPERVRRPLPFSGILRCGACSSGFVLFGKHHYGCAAARNRGTCTNRLTIRSYQLEAQVLGRLREELLHPDLLVAFIEEYRRELARLRAADRAPERSKRRELARVEKGVRRIIEAVKEGFAVPQMRDEWHQLERAV